MSQAPTDTEFAPADVKRLAALLEKHDLTELRYEQDDVRVTLRTAAFFRQQNMGVPVSLPAAPATEAHGEDTFVEGDDETAVLEAPGVSIEAPIMGTFYRSASPADPPFIEVGDAVEVGQVVGLIEAMKVFSEVKSDVAGTVLSIPVVNKALVQPGEALVTLSVE